MGDQNQTSGRKRKIKNNKFISRAKKKMKEGRFDILDAETYEYFLRIGESLRTMTADEDKTDFCSNVLKETAGKEWDVMRHAMSSRILEAVVPVAPWVDMEGLREAARDRRSWEGMGCPARVLECLLKDATRRMNEGAPEKVECIKFLETKSRLFLNNLEQQIWETNANHVTRFCLSCCSETSEDKLHEVVKETALYVIGWGQLNDHFSNPLISGFLQILISSSRKCCPKTCDKLLKHLNEAAFSPKAAPPQEGDLPAVFSDEPLLRLLEGAVTESSDKMFLKLYNKFFKDHLLQLALSDSYFALNKLISACSDKFIFEEIYGVLMETIDEVAGRPKILTALSERCLALTTKQGDFIQKIKVWLGCEQKEEKFAHCLLRMKKLSEIDENSKIDMNGSLVLQNIFKFNKPIKVVESFLSLDPRELRAIAEDTKGSWVFNSFLDSPSVGDKSRMRLLGKLRGSYLPLASTKFGSRVFEELWKAAKFKDRQQVTSDVGKPARPHRLYDATALQKAAAEVKAKGLTYRRAAEKYAVPFSTIHNAVKGNHTKNIGRPRTLSITEEEDLVRGLLKCAEPGFPLKNGDVKDLVNCHLESTGRVEKMFNTLSAFDLTEVFEELWKSAKFKDQLQMIGELDRTLLSSLAGRAVAKNVQLELYLTDKKSWASKQSNVKNFSE